MIVYTTARFVGVTCCYNIASKFIKRGRQLPIVYYYCYVNFQEGREKKTQLKGWESEGLLYTLTKQFNNIHGTSIIIV